MHVLIKFIHFSIAWQRNHRRHEERMNIREWVVAVNDER